MASCCVRRALVSDILNSNSPPPSRAPFKRPQAPLLVEHSQSRVGLGGARGTAGTGKLEAIGQSAADVVGLDWHTDIGAARQALGLNVRVQGNVDPLVLFGTEGVIRDAVASCCRRAGRRGHILNVGHGVIQETPEENVALFCQLARESAALFDVRQPVAA